MSERMRSMLAAVMLLTGRDWLHRLVRLVDAREITTAAQFLILSGVVLPLLPAEPVTSLTSITPRQVWLALTLVSAYMIAHLVDEEKVEEAITGMAKMLRDGVKIEREIMGGVGVQ